MPNCRLILPLLLITSATYAQISPYSLDSTGDLEVRVQMNEGGSCEPTRVTVVSSSGGGIADGLTDGDCAVRFRQLPVGSYHAVVSGPGIESSDTGQFQIESHRTARLEATVRRAENTRQVGYPASGNPLVSSRELMIPRGARHEFEKANEQIAGQDWRKALEKLNHAVAIYPGYVEAYNNMAVVYGHLGDEVNRRGSLEKAISLDQSYAPALSNLAKIAIADRDLPRAESLLQRAIAADPNNANRLVLLEHVQFVEEHYADALDTAQRAHTGGQPDHAMAHFIAARILQQLNRPADALAEFKSFLAEQPSGEKAESAREAIRTLQSSAQ